MWTSDCIAFFMLVVSCQGQGGILNNSVLWVASDGYLYFSTRLQEWTEAKITPQEFGQSIKSVVIKDASSIHGIAGDIPTRHLVTSDTDNNWIILFDLDANGITYFHIGTSKDIGHLAIDWLGRNVYWTDAGFGWIAMKHLPENITQINSADQNFRVVVDEFIEKPTGIVVHPERYFLFWTDTGHTPKIERSNLIGQERKTIIWQSIITPTTLCIDQSAERLYWSDPERRTIEYSDFDGNGRRILVSHPELNYYGIAVFRDSLIYTVPNFNRTGYVSLKENNEGEHIQASIEIEKTKLFDVMAYASEIQEEPTDALCKKVNECDQICLHMEMDAGFTCLCSDGYDLISGRNCTVDEKVLERHILFTNDKSICAVPVSVLSLGSSVAAIFSIHCDLVQSDSYVTRCT
ncbi:low-density lipoprotein receptor-related protein 4-like isoform X2 [Ruditapes philippinarum]|uniref:low-density lipoprotein receptor-related protein 4-like isoform X2 n=1 Tax=Ruditapes philippinarum TaxID=129788 RepID=UPI00295AE1E5|nr:low-density lipoprotein receptor-related protein 4-like isoform X2 [Ruditapes philippinarum]XP_060593845.1 low-density lipoprotein receptor-related protein 4-like isoform X2 [Ruditapes philippinarum]